MDVKDKLQTLHEMGIEFEMQFKKEKAAEKNEPMALKEESQAFTPAKPIEDSALEKVKTLDELRAYMNAFDKCALKWQATQMVFSDGVPTAEVMFIGEAPGAEEDRQGKPFVGQSGQLLDKFLSFIGLSRAKNVYIANIVPWRPPENRAPTNEEIAICRPLLMKHIALIKPKVIVFLGATSFRGVMGVKEGILKARGQWYELDDPFVDQPIKCMPIFHPAFLLRSPKQKAYFWHDLLTIKKFIAEA